MWRNVRYGQEGDRRLPVLRAPRGAPSGQSLRFGQRFGVRQTQWAGPDDSEHWLRLDTGLQESWVLAEGDGFVNCVELAPWVDAPGRVPAHAFRGQAFPTVGMYTEGYDGSSDICLISASGDGFWREINIEMLFRDIATATVFEQGWAGDASFTDWVASWTNNLTVFGGMNGSSQKRFLVTVKPGPRWRRYMGQCIGPPLSEIKDDIGRAQYKECEWLCRTTQTTGVNWGDVEFLTACTFLRRHCQWRPEDCKEAAREKLHGLWRRFEELREDRRLHELLAALWSCDEAFEGEELGERERAAVLRMLRRMRPAQRERGLAAAARRSEVLFGALDDAELRPDAQQAVRGMAAAEAAEALALGLRHPSERVQAASAEVLETLGPTLQPILAQLQPALEDYRRTLGGGICTVDCSAGKDQVSEFLEPTTGAWRELAESQLRAEVNAAKAAEERLELEAQRKDKALEEARARLAELQAATGARIAGLEKQLDVDGSAQKAVKAAKEAAEKELKKQAKSNSQMSERLAMASEELFTRQAAFALDKQRLSGALEESRRTLRHSLGVPQVAAVDSVRIAGLEQQLSEERRKSIEQVVALQRAERRCSQLEETQRRTEEHRSDAVQQSREFERRVITLTEDLRKLQLKQASSDMRREEARERSCMAAAELSTVRYEAKYESAKLRGALDELRYMLKMQGGPASGGYPRRTVGGRY